MEVAIGGGTAPFQRREVREWQTVDPNTGALLTGRLEADRWINGPLNTYGKVVDSKNVTVPNGIHHTQRKQLEVLQARTSTGGSLQVVRAHTVQTSSSRWSTKATHSTTTSSSTSTSAAEQQFSGGIGAIVYRNGDNDAGGGDFNDFYHHPTTKNGIGRPEEMVHHQNKSATDIPHGQNSHTMSQFHHQHNGNHITSEQTNHNHNHSSNHLHNLHLKHLESPLHSSSQQHHHHQQQQQQLQYCVPAPSLSLPAAGSTAPSDCSLQKLMSSTGTKTTTTTTGAATVAAAAAAAAATSPCSGMVGDKQLDSSNERETISLCNNHFQSKFSRARSASTEDLASERDEQHFDDDVEPMEWRRVSKIRRSLQFPKSSTASRSFFGGGLSSRPLDLPENSVSVSKIRQELENGRRLNTAMRNNHVDLVALDNILRGVSDSAPKNDQSVTGKPSKKTTFITAESLKEIRGKLRRLSDESLYKDDILVGEVESPPPSSNTSTIDHQEAAHTNSIEIEEISSTLATMPGSNLQSRISSQSNSLESSKHKFKDFITNEWHSRRKSYGFEKMVPPSESMARIDASTDSGIGRSGELNSCWSPTATEPNTQKGTVITFGEGQPKNGTVTLLNTVAAPVMEYNPIYQAKTKSASEESDRAKRHSIAVDESKYVKENLRRVFEGKTSVHLNGSLFGADSPEDRDGKRNRRVGFCKTEVHFAAESGRVNIVETDGKPPPTNNFRRRRRTGSLTNGINPSYLDAVTTGAPLTHFGDSEKRMFNSVEKTSVEHEVTISTPATFDAMDMDDFQFSDEISIRGILKNKPIKPKPYHLGENIDSGESLWGVRLRPVSGDFSSWRKSAEIEDAKAEEDHTNSINIPIAEDSAGSVAERVRLAEERKSLGFSTKVNLNAATAPSANHPSLAPAWLPKDYNRPTHGHIGDLAKDYQAATTRICIDMSSSPGSGAESSSKSSPIDSVDHELKSTSLIMRTMKSNSVHTEELPHKQSPPTWCTFESGNDFDKDHSYNSAFKLISNMHAITKSSSANSIYKDQPKIIKPKYSSSLDGDCILSDRRGGDFHQIEEDSTEMTPQALPFSASSSSFSSTSSASFSYERTKASSELMKASSSSISRIDEHREHTNLRPIDPDKPIAAPRLKKIGSSHLLSHQLSQLRRIYDAADSDDSARADEEVNLYLGSLGGGAEERTSELSGSWSRIKAKRNHIRQNQEDSQTKAATTGLSNLDYQPKAKAENIHSNVMSISLHSPNNSFRKSSNTATPSIADKTPQSTETTPKSSRKVYGSEISTHKDVTKMVNGARKLREHELSYFGVAMSKPQHFTVGKSSAITAKSSTNVMLSSTKSASFNMGTSTTTTTSTSANVGTGTGIGAGTSSTSALAKPSNTVELNKWQLTNDKPDLLRHSPKANKTIDVVRNGDGHAKKNTPYHEARINNDQRDPIYENIKQPSTNGMYNRRLDLEMDERILSELSKAADEILTAVTGYTDESSADERKRRHAAAARSTPKPLDTITEDRSTTSGHRQMRSKAVQVTRAAESSRHTSTTYAHRSRQVSSASSTESLTKSSAQVSRGPSLQGSRRTTASSRAHEGSPRESVGGSSSRCSRRTRTTNSLSETSRRLYKTSSRDTLQSHASSSEDLPSRTAVEVPRRPRRLKTKERTDTSLSAASQRPETRQKSSSASRSLTDRLSLRKSHRGESSAQAHSYRVSQNGISVEPTATKIKSKSGVTETTSSRRGHHCQAESFRK